MRRAAAGFALAACSAVPDTTYGPPWIDGPPLPTARNSVGAGAVGDTLVMIGGETAGEATAEADAINTGLVFAGGSATWMQLPPLPQAGTDLQVAAVGTRIFVLGGFDATGAAFGASYVLDTSAGNAAAWAPVTALPTLRGDAAVVALPPKIYLLGGATALTGAALASVTSYDTQGDFWCPDPSDTVDCPTDDDLPDLPASRFAPAALVRTDDGTFVVAGGSPSPGAVPAADVWWLPLTLTGGYGSAWVAMTSMPSPIADCAYGSIGGRLICAGGEVACTGAAGVCAGGSAFAYESSLEGSSSSPWCRLADLPAATIAGHGAAVGARLFVAGGAAATGGSATDALFVYSSGDDPAIDPIPDTAHDPMLCPQ